MASFFSGGIDSLSTLLKNKDELTHLIYINGFDFEMPTEVFAKTVERRRKMVEVLGKTLIPVETNHFSLMAHHKIGRLLNYGSCIASVALLLGFPKVLIPASFTYNDLPPNGSHPATDHLWSSEMMQIIHDGSELTRTDKYRQLDGQQNIIDNLIVCWNEPDGNCGSCGKCIRTMIMLELLKQRSKMFTKKIGLIDILKLKIDSHLYFSFFADLIELAIQNKRWGVTTALKVMIWKNKIKLMIISVDKRLLRGFIKGVYSKIRHGSWLTSNNTSSGEVGLTPE